MKKWIFSAAVITGVQFAQAASAQTLEDVLRQKGVISEEDYKEVTKSQSSSKGPAENPSVAYRLGEGFTFTSADRKYQGSFGGFLQLRYTYSDLEQSNNKGTKSVQDSSQFSMSRVKIFFGGYSLTPDLTYKLQVNITQGNILSTGKQIEEAYLNYRILDGAQLRFGQDKVPFARQFITSSTTQEFADLTHVVTAFAPGYDAGFLVHGKVADGLVTYGTGVFGGMGQGTPSNTMDPAVVGRIAINPLGDFKYSEGDVDNTKKPLVSFGANYYGDTIINGSSNNVNILSSTGWIGLGSKLMPTAFATDKLDISTVGYDAAFKWRGFFTQAEYFAGRAEGKNSHNTLRARGFYGQAGYFVLPGKLEVVGRYAYLDPNRDVTNDHWVETAGGVNWYLNKHNLKLQADYTAIHKQPGVALNNGPNTTDDKRVRVQAQILF